VRGRACRCDNARGRLGQQGVAVKAARWRAGLPDLEVGHVASPGGSSKAYAIGWRGLPTYEAIVARTIPQASTGDPHGCFILVSADPGCGRRTDDNGTAWRAATGAERQRRPAVCRQLSEDLFRHPRLALRALLYVGRAADEGRGG
jgi:hypothetical protein